MHALEQIGLEPHSYIIAAGESSKNIEQYISLLERLSQLRLARTDCVLALGGGVVGDLAGFAAATYLRGIQLVQAPTTLLAMVDSSVGGKTAINLPTGKNLVGAFYQPSLVIADTATLGSLPKPIFNEGIAECIKYGMLDSPELLEKLKKLQNDGIGDELTSIIADCVSIKRIIVEQDEFDTGKRMLLNFGHTIGHAIERLENYQIPHGNAVALGMAIDTRAAVRKNLCLPECLPVLHDLLERYNLPKQTTHGANEIYEAALHDKKRSGADITNVTPRSLGNCRLTTMPIESLKSWIETGLDL
jgi:3-dehydroquinate synthase